MSKITEHYPKFMYEVICSGRDYKQLAEKIGAKLLLISGVGKVLLFHRDFKDKRDLVAAGMLQRQDLESGEAGAQRLNLWIVSRRSSTDRKEGQECDTIRDSFILRGYLGLKENRETELEFQQIVNNVQEGFRLHDTFGGLCETCDPAEVETIDWAMLGGVLCHFAELRLDVQFFLTGQSS